jgi:hypothetical protein
MTPWASSEGLICKAGAAMSYAGVQHPRSKEVHRVLVSLNPSRCVGTLQIRIR